MADLVISNPKRVDGLKLTAELLGIASGVSPCPDTLTIHDCTNNDLAVDIYNAHVAVFDANGFPVQSTPTMEERVAAIEIIIPLLTEG